MTTSQRINIKNSLVRILIIISFIALYANPSSAQSKLPAFAFQLNEGFIAPHHAYMRYLIKGHVISGNLEIFLNERSDKYWKTAYHFPLTAWGIYYANLNNPDQLGNVIAVYKKIQVPLGKSGNRFYHINAGVSYLTNHFDAENNYYNTIIGSNLNVFFRLGLISNIVKIKNWILYADLNFVHYSNGNYYEPNAGINVANLGVGFRPQIDLKSNKLNNELTESTFYKLQTEVITAGSVKSISQETGKNYFAGSIVLNEIYRPNFKNAFDAGLDVFYDATAKRSAIYTEFEDFNNSDFYRMGFHAGYEPQFGKTSIAIQMGVYLYDRMHLETPLFHRVALKQQLSDGIVFGVAIKTHFFKAEFIEWGIGYRFFKKKQTDAQI